MVKSSIIIPTYNEEKDIGNCLESLKKQSYKDFEIIVVDDGSNDKTREIVKGFKKIKLIEGEHKGPGFSRNLGAKIAKGDILVFVDADMTFDKEYIKNLIEPIKSKTIIGTTHDYEVAVNGGKEISRLWGRIRVSKETAQNVKIFRAIQKNKFLEMGDFDSKYGYADDQTFWYKYKIKPIVAKNTTCYHKNPETLKETYKQARWIGESWGERFLIFRIPFLKYLFSVLFFGLIPFLSLLKAFRSKEKFKISFKFYLVKFWGYGVGNLKSVFRKNY